MVVVKISFPTICILLPATKVCVVDIVVPLILIPVPAVSVGCTLDAVIFVALILVTLIFGVRLTLLFKILMFVPAVKLLPPVAEIVVPTILIFVPAVSLGCTFDAVILVAVIFVALILVVVSFVEMLRLDAFIVAPFEVVALIVPVVISDELRFVLHILVDVILVAVTSEPKMTGCWNLVELFDMVK